MKSKNKLHFKYNKGISLLSLIITIVIMLILIGIVILPIGDNGLITKVIEAQFKLKVNNYKEVLMVNLNKKEIESILKNKNNSGYYSSWEEGYDTKGTIKELIPEISEKDAEKFKVVNKELVSNGDYTEKEKIWLEQLGINIKNLINNGVKNAAHIMRPVLSEGLYPVIINEDLTETYVSKFDEKWFAYIDQGLGDNKMSIWANAVTKDENSNINGTFVWIPRYAYKITYTNPSNKRLGGSIDVIFVDKDNKQVDGSSLPDDYIVHPAFQNGSSTGYLNGEWDKELAGIWVSKYEVSGNISKLQVRPNTESLRHNSISNAFTASLNYGNTIENGDNLNSHLIKNSEWGAASYLAHSKYGRNTTEVNINNTYSFISGIGTDTSTTGNHSGIYDMSGVSWEYVSAYINNNSSSLQNNGFDLVNNGNINNSNKYKTIYSIGNVDNVNSNFLSNSKKGDAIYEVATASSARDVAWFSDYFYFPDNNSTFFVRGGGHNTGKGHAGLFYLSSTNGHNDNNILSWRVVLAP